MTQTSKTIVFFGSGPVAARSLELLAESFEIELVITKPRPTHHKGPVPVVEVAERLGLPLLQIRNKRELSERLVQQPIASELAILIDFGIIVEQAVIDKFPLGIVNSHFSLLPEWRGADPITFSILSGQVKTGVSLMLLVEAMDEGPLLAQGEYDLPPTITTPELTAGLIDLSYGLLREIIPLYLTGGVSAAPQEEYTIAPSIIPSYSRKFTKADSILDWSKPAQQLEREIRAFAEWPKSRTVLGGMDVVVTKAHTITQDEQLDPGTIIATKNSLHIATSEDIFAIDELVPAGKKPMPVRSFLAGYRSRL